MSASERRMNAGYPISEPRLFDPGPPIAAVILPALQEVGRAYGLHIPPGSVVEVRLRFQDGRSLSLSLIETSAQPAPEAQKEDADSAPKRGPGRFAAKNSAKRKTSGGHVTSRPGSAAPGASTKRLPRT